MTNTTNTNTKTKITVITPNENYPKFLYAYFSKIIKNYLSTHKLYTDATSPIISTSVILSEKIVNDWYKFFNVNVATNTSNNSISPLPLIPFPYFSSVNNIAFIELLNSIHTNTNNLLFTRWIINPSNKKFLV